MMNEAMQRLAAALADRYRIERELGQGGMATVYLAEDLKHDRKVALKVLKPELASVLGAERFLQEIRVTSRLQHPNILPLFDSGAVRQSHPEHGEGPLEFLYYVMPYVEGESLRSRIDRERQLSVADAVEIARDVAGALKHAHDAGIIHRDIKPENILLRDGRAFVADFGIAIAAAEAGGTRLTEVGMSLGTPTYMSPEQAMGDRDLTAATDQYALAGVIYEVLAGDPPFPGSSAQAVIGKILTETPTPLAALRKDVPAESSAAVARALSKIPADRFGSVSEFAEAVKAGTTGQSPAARRQHTGPGRWLIGAAVIILLAGAGWLVTRERGGTAAEGSPNYLAIFPFAYDGDPSGAFVGASIGHLMGRAIDGVGPLHTADPAAIRAQLEREGTEIGDPIVGRTIARRMGAGRFVVGSIVQSGANHLLISATAYDVATGAERGRASAEGAPDSLQAIVVRLSVQLAQALGISRGPMDLARITTASPVALAAFLRGANAADRGRHDLAVTEFVQAVHEDPQFALAWRQLSWEMTWTATPGIRGALDSAIAHQDRLSERDRNLVLADKAFREARIDDFRIHVRAILDRNPDDAEGLYRQANLEVHYGPQAGWISDGLLEQWDRLLVVAPNSVEAADHLAWTASRREDIPTLKRALEKGLELSPDNEKAPASRLSLAAMAGDSAAIDAELNALAGRSGADLLGLTYALYEAGGDPPLLQRVVALALAPGQAAPLRREATLLFGLLSMAQGAWADGWGQFHAASVLGEQDDPAQTLWSDVNAAFMAIMPFAPAPRPVLDSLRRSIAPLAWTTGSGLSREEFEAVKAYALGVLAAHTGDRPTALRYANELARMPDGRLPGHPGDFARRIRAHVAAVDNRPAAVIAELETLSDDGYASQGGDPISSRSLERLLLAQALEAVGRDRDALRWYESLWAGSLEDMSYKGPSHFHRGEIYERLGEPAKAREQYLRFLAVWRRPDPRFAPLMEDVRGRVARLEEVR
jgi:tRNA A-37 threonylcarbamoyl transferase component Bud32/tetratricopeptide (TPR) repeat protein